MKITGASEGASRKVPEYLRNGQGRWRLLAKEPTQMVQKYIQSTLADENEKLTTSGFGAAILQQLRPVTPVLYNYIEYDIWGWWLFWDWLRSTTVYSSTSLLRFSL
jgi:hypothetical protein